MGRGSIDWDDPDERDRRRGIALEKLKRAIEGLPQLKLAGRDERLGSVPTHEGDELPRRVAAKLDAVLHRLREGKVPGPEARRNDVGLARAATSARREHQKLHDAFEMDDVPCDIRDHGETRAWEQCGAKDTVVVAHAAYCFELGAAQRYYNYGGLFPAPKGSLFARPSEEADYGGAVEFCCGAGLTHKEIGILMVQGMVPIADLEQRSKQARHDYKRRLQKQKSAPKGKPE